MSEFVLETRDVCKRFGALQASSDVNINLRPGEIHALIGPNGAGKSTLIQQISGALQPDSGQIILGGEEVTHLDTVARVKRGLARTFQVSALAMEDTVLQNALLGAVAANGTPFKLLGSVYKDNTVRAHAIESLERVGLADFARTRVAELSHGQRRQLEIAIALTVKPKAFVMDEPMAGLGVEGSATLTQFLDVLRSEAPILLVEHDMDAVFALANRISVLVYGKVLATGSVSEIRSNEAVRDAYLGSDL